MLLALLKTIINKAVLHLKFRYNKINELNIYLYRIFIDNLNAEKLLLFSVEMFSVSAVFFLAYAGITLLIKFKCRNISSSCTS